MSDTAGWLTGQQVHVILAAYLGWTLDAFDFFIMAFVLREVAATFSAPRRLWTPLPERTPMQLIAARTASKGALQPRQPTCPAGTAGARRRR